MSPCDISKEKTQLYTSTPSRPVLLSRSSTLSQALTLIQAGRTHVRMWWAGAETHLAAFDGDGLKRWGTDFLFLSASIPVTLTAFASASACPQQVTHTERPRNKVASGGMCVCVYLEVRGICRVLDLKSVQWSVRAHSEPLSTQTKS